ncbi:MAG TPA: beta-propeller fold lactonase family protein [Terracidiphilus sp.]|nr:beta-propeller fold lactonase family protein [Terracidiphilus sp.]
MKFTKFGKALLMCAISGGIIFGVSSCVRSYTVGFLYVTGTETAQSGNNGVITGFKIDHNTGRLAQINGLPISSGGSNPVRAVLTLGSKFIYVLNRGVNAEGNGDCTTDDPCQNANVTQFAVGGNGILTPQQTFFTQGLNPIRLVVDPTGSYLFVLDHDSIGADGVSPSSSTNPNVNCGNALSNNLTVCADITVFQINQTTGRLSTVLNTQVTQANCPGGAASCPLSYFPVPSDPIDFVLASTYMLTMYGTPATGDSIWPYAYQSTSGQLTLSQNSAQPLTDPYSSSSSGPSAGLVTQATAIVAGGGEYYVLDNEPITITVTVDGVTSTYSSGSQILPYGLGANGSLTPDTSGIFPDAPALANPTSLMAESKGKYLYVANQGNNVTGNNNPESGIGAWEITTTPTYQFTYVTDEPFGSGSGPQCIVEDPSNQYVYEANFYDSSVTGRVLDPNSGELDDMRVTSSYSLRGPATWCLVDGRTG